MSRGKRPGGIHRLPSFPKPAADPDVLLFPDLALPFAVESDDRRPFRLEFYHSLTEPV
jgi:hypothetical protein